MGVSATYPGCPAWFTYETLTSASPETAWLNVLKTPPNLADMSMPSLKKTMAPGSLWNSSRGARGRARMPYLSPTMS